MKGKIAFVLGAATGYVLGTRAGRERYEQIKRAAQSVWATAPVQNGVTAVKGAVGDRVEAAQQAVVRGGKDLFITVIRRTEKTSGSATSGLATSNSTVGVAAEAATTKARTPQATSTKVTPGDIASAQKASTAADSSKTEHAAGTANTNKARSAKADATES